MGQGAGEVQGRPDRRLRWLMAIGAGAGSGLAVWLIATNDAAAVGAAFARVGVAGLAAVILIRAAILALCGLAWARLLSGLVPAPARAFLLLRWIRESINVLLPVASVGGDVLGGRLVTAWGVAGSLAAASIMADLLIQACTQAVFALMGVGVLSRMEGAEAASIAAWSERALALSVLALGAFFLVQRSGVLARAERGIVALVRRWSPSTPEDETRSDTAVLRGVQHSLDDVWGRGRRWRLAEGVALHLLAWLLGTAEVAVALWAMGYEVSLAGCLAIESLAQAIRSAAFPVPGGLGVQEGGFVVLGALFGVDPGAALALSLVKRVPDVALGLPGLIAWQAVEARRAAARIT